MNKIKIFTAEYINDIENNINSFLEENKNITIINLYEVRKFDISYCFCLVYKINKQRKPYEKC